MSKKDSLSTKSRIIKAAWDLFYEQGYNDTTIDDIVERSETSKGSFYHYFESKDALLSSLSYLFDEKYSELENSIDPETNSFDKLVLFNRELFLMIENSIPIDLLARLLSTQLTTIGKRHLLDHSRLYFRLLRKTVIEGQKRGELRNDLSANEIVKAYAMLERSLMYDWCICNGEYSLYKYSSQILPMFLNSYKIN